MSDEQLYVTRRERLGSEDVSRVGGKNASHAGIVSRELGLPAIAGTKGATHKVKDGQEVTVCCAEGDEGYINVVLMTPFGRSPAGAVAEADRGKS